MTYLKTMPLYPTSLALPALYFFLAFGAEKALLALINFSYAAIMGIKSCLEVACRACTGHWLALDVVDPPSLQLTHSSCCEWHVFRSPDSKMGFAPL